MNINYEPDSFTVLAMEDLTQSEDFMDPLWHYTSLSGLMGILPKPEKENDEDLTFWFTRSDCLNDISEGMDVLGFLSRIGANLYTKGQICKALFEITQNESIPLKQIVKYPIKQYSEEGQIESMTMFDYVDCEAYICCFSKAENQLDMWRYYSKSEDGYSLEFDSSLLFYEQEEYGFNDANQLKMTFSNLKKLNVLYTDEDKRAFMEYKLIKASEGYEEVSARKGERIAKQKLKYYIDLLVQENQYRFKHECFKNEMEFRFVEYRPIEKPKRLNDELPTIKYRRQHGVLVPYIEVRCSKNALRSIQISPYVHTRFSDETTTNIMQNYLKQFGINWVSISKSNLPIRF